jgi:hypothetical protein
MILDTGICTVFRKADTSAAGAMPVMSYTPIWCSWYRELSYETAPAWPTDGRTEQKADGRIRILQDRAIAKDDVVILEQLAAYKDRSQNAKVYRITRAYHGMDDDGPTQISDLMLEVIEP